MSPESANALIAFCALVVSLASILLAREALVSQRRHNRMSVRPSLAVGLADYEERQTVRVVNRGLGPAEITCIRLLVGDEDQKSKKLHEILPAPPNNRWKNYAGNIEGDVLPPNGHKVLLEFCSDGSPAENKFREDLRRELANVTARIKYVDFYGSSFLVEKKMSWFGRNQD